MAVPATLRETKRKAENLLLDKVFDCEEWGIPDYYIALRKNDRDSQIIRKVKPKRPKETIERMKKLDLDALPDRTLDYVPPNSSKTQIVKPARLKGVLYQDFDVYIDGQIKNEHYDLEKSMWANPFYKWSLNNDPDTSLCLYMDYVLGDPQLMSQLHTLRGKRLGTFSHPKRRTHGDVLIYLLEQLDKNQESFLDQPHVYRKCERKKIAYFKGKQYPLSNLYPSPIKYDGKDFKNVYHALCYMKAVSLKAVDLEKKLLTADDDQEIALCGSKLQTMPQYKSIWSDTQTISNMYLLLKKKYEACPEFVDCLEYNAFNTILEATKNQFWGIGSDLKEIETYTLDPYSNCAGKNILGWLLKLVHQRMKFGEYATYRYLTETIDQIDSSERKYPIYLGLQTIQQGVIKCKLSFD